MKNFQTAKSQAVLSSFFGRAMILHVVVIGVVGGGGFNIGVSNGV